MARWIDCEEYSTKIGTTGYLVETFNTSNGRTSFSLHERPLRTNQSHKPRLRGWCGETNNRSQYARGVWRVSRMNATGTRAQIVPLSDSELAAFLEGDGYPELIPQVANEAAK